MHKNKNEESPSKKWKTALQILAAGGIIELLHLVSYCLVYPRFGIGYLVGITSVVGTVIAVIVTCTNNRSPWHALIRWFMLMGACFLVMLFNAYTGISRFLLSTYPGGVGAGTENAIGLQMLVTSIVIFGSTLLIILMRAVFWEICKVVQRRKSQ